MRDVESKGGRNGADGPGFVQLDMRVGYRARMGGRRSLDIFYEMFNVTDRANFTNPGGNMRERRQLPGAQWPGRQHRLPASVADRTEARVLTLPSPSGIRGRRVAWQKSRETYVSTIPLFSRSAQL